MKDQYTFSSKQRINLSYKAEEIIRFDISCFTEDSGDIKFGGAVNRIFMSFCHDSIANIPAAVAAEKDKLVGQMDKLKSSDNDKEAFKNHLIVEYEAALEKKVARLANKKAAPNPITLYVQEKTMDYLLHNDVKSFVRRYYGGPGKYIKAVIEEYAEKPYVEREAIFFKDIIADIRRNIGKRLIVSCGGRRYGVRPYDVVRDTLSAYNYLAGYSAELKGKNNDNDKEQMASFRIARITNIQVLEKDENLSEREKKTISDAIINKGAQFLLGVPIKVTIRLTEKGQREYKRQIHLRPAYAERINSDIFIFNCTEWQIKVYFLKFGKDVEVISPESLRREFYHMYRDAEKVYEASGTGNLK